MELKQIPDAMKNVDFVVNSLLCTSCGTCVGICPTNAIRMQIDKYGIYVPKIDPVACNQCGLCIRVCPGHGFDYVKYQKRLYGKLPDNAAIGSYLDIFAGHACDDEILRLSQSGGFVSSLLLFCIEKNIIDGAVVTKSRKDRPLETETYIARNREEVLAAMGSKYQPVPASQILSTLRKEKGRFAFVGTSCQVQGMRKAEDVFPDLSNKIALYIGLHCLGVCTYHFLDQTISKCGLKKTEVTYFRNRDKAPAGWPQCDTRIIDKKGVIYDIHANKSRHWPRPYFTSWRCLLCFDKANEFSDVSCGDCRIPQMYSDFEQDGYDLLKGLSEFIVRTPRAKKVIDAAISQGIFIVRSAKAEEIAQSVGVAGKKLAVSSFIKIAKLWKAGIPQYNVSFTLREQKTSKWTNALTTVFSMHYYIVYKLNAYKFFRNILKLVPHRFLGILNSMRNRSIKWEKHKFPCDLQIITPNRKAGDS